MSNPSSCSTFSQRVDCHIAASPDSRHMLYSRDIPHGIASFLKAINRDDPVTGADRNADESEATAQPIAEAAVALHMIPMSDVGGHLSQASIDSFAVSLMIYLDTSFERVHWMKLASRRRLEEATPEEITLHLAQALNNKESAEITILTLMRIFDFDLHEMKKRFQDMAINFSFSKVKYADMAPFVGLDADLKLRDVGSFELYQSRIPSSMYRTILENIDGMLLQYGPMRLHGTEEARSRVFSPIFNCLLPLFRMHLVNLPESILEGNWTTKGRIEYMFVSFGRVTVLFVEFKLKLGTDTERLDAVAQVIAEADACDYSNQKQGLHIPVYGILCDGEKFEFYKFQRKFHQGGPKTERPVSQAAADAEISLTAPENNTSAIQSVPGCEPEQDQTNPSAVKSDTTFDSVAEVTFSKGKIRGKMVFSVIDFNEDPDSKEFIRTLRPVCEIIFDLLLLSYRDSMELHTKMLRERQKTEKYGKRPSLEAWDRALASADNALKTCREAHHHCEELEVAESEEKATAGQVLLARSVYEIPRPQVHCIMDTYDDEFVIRTGV